MGHCDPLCLPEFTLVDVTLSVDISLFFLPVFDMGVFLGGKFLLAYVDDLV